MAEQRKRVMQKADEFPLTLPTFKGYTVDMRLREFRKAAYPEPIEFIPFDSPRGRRLLRQMGREHLADPVRERG